MIEYSGYLILENKEDFLKYWDKDRHHWKHDYMKSPRTFPCSFIYQKSLEPLFCGAWRHVPIKEAKEQIKNALIGTINEFEGILTHLNEIKT